MDTKRAVQLTIPRIFRSLYTLMFKLRNESLRNERMEFAPKNLHQVTLTFQLLPAAGIIPTCIRFAVAFTAALAVGRSMDVSTALAAARLCHRARFSCHVKIKCNWHQYISIESWKFDMGLSKLLNLVQSFWFQATHGRHTYPST